jgi:hypothetical protein
MTLDPLLNSKNVAGISMGYKLMLRTRLSKILGIEFPIFSAPMRPDLAGPDLAAAFRGRYRQVEVREEL